MQPRATESSQRAAGSDGQLADPEGGESTSSQSDWHERAVSQIKLNDPSLLRGVTSMKMLRGFGEVLTRKPARRDYYEWSMEAERISTFISHSWATPRWSKLLVLLLHFNIWPAVAISSLVSLTCCWLVVRGTIPHIVAESLKSQGPRPHSVACTPVGMLAFWASLFTLHELERFASPCIKRVPRRAFLDKICIHQTDLELKRRAIQSLAAFLAKSDYMLVCYSDLYLRRLWTIYEVATWLIVQPGKLIMVRPVSRAQMLLYGQLMMCIYVAAVLASAGTSLVASMPSLWFFATTVLAGAPPIAAVAWYGGRWAEEECRIKDVAEGFSWASAQCAVEADKPEIEANIVAFMKYAGLADPGGEDEEVVKAFEDLVHQKVPELLRASFGPTGVPYAWTLVPLLPIFFYEIDQIADVIMRDISPRLFCLYPMSAAVGVFALGPFCMGVTMKIMRLPRMRSFCGCVAVGTAVSLLASTYVTLSRELLQNATDSYLGLLALLGMLAATIAAAVAVYRH